VGVEKLFAAPTYCGATGGAESVVPSSRSWVVRIDAAGGGLRKRTNRLRFCAAAARKNCSRTNFKSAQTPTPQSDLIFQFREQGFYFFPLPLCRGKLRRVR
jgi:hypothetical protein